MAKFNEIVFGVLNDVKAEKDAESRWPNFTLKIKDRLHERINAKCKEVFGTEYSKEVVDSMLDAMVELGMICTGPTAQDTYYEIPQVEVTNIINP